MVTIATVAGRTGISAYNLRFYEKEGLISVPRTKAGIRDFDEATESRINAIRHYRCAGLSLAQIKEVFANTDKHEMIIGVPSLFFMHISLFFNDPFSFNSCRKASISCSC